MSMYMFRDSRVSIHASVKDATCSHRRKQPVQQVSIHASVKDATCIVVVWIRLILFQSTHL